MKGYRWTLAVAALSVAFVLFASARRDSLSTVWGDESTYLAMAESMARDGDLSFDASDAKRLESRTAHSRSVVILQSAAGAVAYSKPILYALLAAPAVLVAGEFGGVLTNALLLAAAAWAGWLFLCRLGDRERATLTMVTFIGASVLLAHVGWRMSDLLQAALALAGLAITLATLRGPGKAGGRGARNWLDRGSSAWVAGALLGCLVSSRLPNLLILATALAALILAGRLRRAIKVAAAATVAFLGLALLSQAMTGAPNAYKATRSSFDATSGYPLAAGDPIASRFETHGSTQAMAVKPQLQPSVSAYSSLYFLIGRHSGLVWYFPAALALLATALRRPDRITVVLLLGAAASVAFYLIWWPQNYFGGSTFLGNRYFLSTYPMLLLALPRLPAKRSLAVSWLLALVVGASAVWSLAAPDTASAGSQSHARRGLLARLPYESTARAIDGRVDRYWAGDLVRFTDSAAPAAEVKTDFFVLHGDQPAVEILLVTQGRDTPMLLRYRTKASGQVLIVEDVGGEQRLELDRGEGVRQGSLVVPLAAGWRRHGFGWSWVARYWARGVRFSIESPDDTSPPVRLWYGGDPAQLDKSFAYEARPPQLPTRIDGGSRSEIMVEVRNTSPVPWSPAGAFPVTLSYRLTPLADAGNSVIEGQRVPLSQDLPSGHVAPIVLPVTWPDASGRYRLTIDLLIEDYDWFSERVGRPIAEGEVEVLTPLNSPAARPIHGSTSVPGRTPLP